MSDTKVKFTCDACGKPVTADRDQVGYAIPCPHCERNVAVPPFGVVEGMKIGDFVVEHRLGIGGMGEVWLATHEAMERKVALKILSPSYAANKDFIDRFMRETKVAAKLIHPNIVTAYHAGLDDRIYYLAIAYVEGVNLEDRLKIEGVLSEDEALRIIHDIAGALDYAWNQFRILHRDIKPANIMIKLDGTAMLLDMGISKCLQEESSMTVPGAVMGTPTYICPEQGRGDADIDFRADMYSLGATLYHLMTGRLPFEATTPMGIVAKHVTEELPDCQQVNPAISDGCKQLIETMMAKRKRDRYDSWEDFLNDLELVRSQQPLPKRVNRKNVWLWTGICAALLLIGALILLIVTLKSEGTHPDHNRENEKNANRMENQDKSEPEEKRMRDMWDYAQKYAEDNPNEFKTAMGHFHKIAESFPDSKYHLMALDEIRRLEELQRRLVERASEKLTNDVQVLVKRREFGQALVLLRDSTGQYVQETKEEREKLIRQVESLQETYQTERNRLAREKQLKAENESRKFSEKIAALLLQGKYKTCFEEFEKSSLKDRYQFLRKPLGDLAKLNDILEKALSKNIGERIYVQRRGELVKATIKDVRESEITVGITQGPATATQTLAIGKLPLEEVKRFVTNDLDPKASLLFQIFCSVRDNQYELALNQIKGTGPLSEALEKQLVILKNEGNEKFAVACLYKILNKLAIKKTSLSDPLLLVQIKNKRLKSRKTAQYVQKFVNAMEDKCAETRFYQENQRIISEIRRKLTEPDEATSSESSEEKQGNDEKGLYGELKSTIGLSDDDTRKLVGIIENLKKKLNDDDVQDKPYLAKEAMEKAGQFIPKSKDHALGDYIRKLMEAEGVVLPPPGGDGRPEGRPPEGRPEGPPRSSRPPPPPF